MASDLNIIYCYAKSTKTIECGFPAGVLPEKN
jgi:hypothetical protein